MTEKLTPCVNLTTWPIAIKIDDFFLNLCFPLTETTHIVVYTVECSATYTVAYRVLCRTQRNMGYFYAYYSRKERPLTALTI